MPSVQRGRAFGVKAGLVGFSPSIADAKTLGVFLFVDMVGSVGPKFG